MKAMLINTESQTVSVVDYDGTLEHAYKLIGCDTVDGRRLDEAGNYLFFDDSGLDRTPLRFFAIIGHPYPFAGNGLIVGPERDEKTSDVTSGLRVTVEFPTARQAVNMFNAQRREDQAALKEYRDRGIEVIDCGRTLVFDESTGEARAL